MFQNDPDFFRDTGLNGFREHQLKPRSNAVADVHRTLGRRRGPGKTGLLPTSVLRARCAGPNKLRCVLRAATGRLSASRSQSGAAFARAGGGQVALCGRRCASDGAFAIKPARDNTRCTVDNGSTRSAASSPEFFADAMTSTTE